MNENFLIYSQKIPNIATMQPSDKDRQWIKIANELEAIIDDYRKNNLILQEMKIFNFLDKPIEEISSKSFSDLEKIIKTFIKKIKEEAKENGIQQLNPTFSKDKSELDLNFKNIFFIVNIMVIIVENISTKGKTSEAIYNFIFKDTIPEFKIKKSDEPKLKQLLGRFNEIKILNICLYKSPEDNYNFHRKKEKQNNNNTTFYMDPKIVFFFGLFYKAFFKTIVSINFNLNISPIDNYFSSNNPYLVNEQQIAKKGREYKDIFICNLILIKTLKKFNYSTNINFKMYDSYQLELHNILTDLFESNINIDNYEMKERKLTMHKISGQKIKNIDINKSYNIKPRSYSIALEENPNFIYSNKFNNNYLYFQHLLNLQGNSFSDFSFDFNSLDPLLFASVNHLLIKFSVISKLNLILFPMVKFNKRKIAMNNFLYNKFCLNEENDNNYFFHDKKIYYQYLDDNENTDRDIFILKDEKVIDEFFFLFNKNLQNLSIILERKLNSLLKLSIDLRTYNNENVALCDYDNYSCSIVCFVFNLFKILETNLEKSQIKSLEFSYDDFNDEKSYIVDTIKRKIPTMKNELQLNNLQLNQLNLNISNISLIIPFENFPMVNLTELTLHNLSYNDLNNLINAIKNKKDIFPLLFILNISLGIFYEDYYPLLEILLKESLNQIQILKLFTLKLPLNISTPELIDILYWIKLSHNNNLQIILKIIHDELSQYIGKDYFINNVTHSFIENKFYLKEKNLLISYKSNDDNNKLKVCINKYKKEEFDFYYNLIYSLQKINDKLKEDKNKAIFENIFGYIGNFQKYHVNIEFNE